MSFNIVIGDPHLDVVWDGLNRTEDVFDALTEVMAKATIMSSPKRVLWLGDIFDSPNVSHSIVSRFMELLSTYPLDGHVILCGNHDGDPKARKGSPLEEVAASGLARVIFEPEEEGSTIYLPYTSQDKVDSFCKNSDRFVGKTVYTHMDINGVTPGVEKEIGRGSPCVLPDIVLTKASRVIAGHIHRPQDFGNLTVVGSVVRVKKDETEPRRYFINDTAILFSNQREILNFSLDYSTPDGKMAYEAFIGDRIVVKDAIVALDLQCPHNLAHEIDQGLLQDKIRRAGCYHLRFNFNVVLEKQLRMKSIQTNMTDYDIIKKFIETQGVSDQALILQDIKEIIK